MLDTKYSVPSVHYQVHGTHYFVQVLESKRLVPWYKVLGAECVIQHVRHYVLGTKFEYTLYMM